MIFFVFTGHYEPRTTEIRDDQAGYKLVFKVVTAVNQTDFLKKTEVAADIKRRCWQILGL